MYHFFLFFVLEFMVCSSILLRIVAVLFAFYILAFLMTFSTDPTQKSSWLLMLPLPFLIPAVHTSLTLADSYTMT